MYRLGRNSEAAEVYSSIAEDEEGRTGGGGFPPVSVNVAAAYAAAGCGEKALEALSVEEVCKRGWRGGRRGVQLCFAYLSD